jgi:hypothetical protein
MPMLPDSLTQISNITQAYFEGLYFADVKKLKAIFSPDSVLKAPGIRRNLEEWLELVQQRAIPAEQGESFRYRILSIEQLGDQAMVKVYCPLLDNAYIDFLGLLREDDQWQIVNKMYADIPRDFL